jgi:hypothetical protein
MGEVYIKKGLCCALFWPAIQQHVIARDCGNPAALGSRLSAIELGVLLGFGDHKRK